MAHGNRICARDCTRQRLGDGAHQQAGQYHARDDEGQRQPHGHQVGIAPLLHGLLAHLFAQLLLQMHQLILQSQKSLRCRAQGGLRHGRSLLHLTGLAQLVQLQRNAQKLCTVAQKFFHVGTFTRRHGHGLHLLLQLGNLDVVFAAEQRHVAHHRRLGGSGTDQKALSAQLRQRLPAHGDGNARISGLGDVAGARIGVLSKPQQPRTQAQHGHHASEHHRPQFVGHSHIFQTHLCLLDGCLHPTHGREGLFLGCTVSWRRPCHQNPRLDDAKQAQHLQLAGAQRCCTPGSTHP